MRPLIYLELRQLINSIKNTARSPKRLIPALLVGAWVVSWFVQGLLLLSGDQRTPRMPNMAVLDQARQSIEAIVFVLLSVGCVGVMYGAFSSGLMVFSLAHIDFLFPTPISRRKVLFIKLLKDYLKYGFWVTFFFVFMGSPMFRVLNVSVMPWGLVSIAAILGLLLIVINLAHTINIVFTFGYERLKQAGVAIKTVLIGAPVAMCLLALYQYAATGGSFASALSALDAPIFGLLFTPARWCTTLFLAPMLGVTSDGLFHLALLWLMAAASAALLFSRRENLYEPSLGVSAKYARRRQTMGMRNYADARADSLREKGTRRLGGTVIRPFGRGATAFLWKNLLLRYRVYRGQLVLMVILPFLIVYLVRRFVSDAHVAQGVPFLLLYMMWILSMSALAEMRADLRYANIVKAMPIAPWKIVLAQVASSVLYLSGGVLLFTAYIWVLVPAARGSTLAACAVASAFLGFANISAVTIASILYPDTRDQAQNFFSGTIGMLLSSIALLPTLIAVVALAYFWRGPLSSAILASAVAVLIVANTAVGAACLAIAGLIFRKFEPTGD